MAKNKTLKEAANSKDDENTLWTAFWKGFFWPVRLIWRALRFVAHHPPVKQIGHALRWFFTRKPVKFIGRMLGARYLFKSLGELRSVTWPTFRESLRLTGAVIVFSIFFGLFITGVDYVLGKLFKEILLK